MSMFVLDEDGMKPKPEENEAKRGILSSLPASL
jgi:hypothetical protein